MTKIGIGIVTASLLSMTTQAVAQKQDSVALRRKCAHALKVKLGIKETGSVNDLQKVKAPVQMVDRCVAHGGKLD